MAELLAALEKLGDETRLIFTMPNADNGGRELISMVENFVATHVNAHAYKSLGQLRFLSTVKIVDGVVGNSSCGLIEAPSLATGTVNIGDRQRGRLRAQSVIDCAPRSQDIFDAIGKLYKKDFRQALASVVNPYGFGGASQKIVQALRTHNLNNVLKKTFYNIDPN
jgi:GDP/UDP-N,N'-diacetylbacillosamine 2-epimerase (hydrolysing)